MDFRTRYSEMLKSLKTKHGLEKAMKLAIGGEFESFGILERELLIQFGLGKNDYVIDVGCGSGRLPLPLSQYLSGKYLGIDVVPELVEYARNLVKRPDWLFQLVSGLKIPEKDNKADMVCFFSVFTHLLHEESFTYLKEAVRVLKPKGKIIFSFLEFAIPLHWAVFESSLKQINQSLPLNVFLSRDAIQAWASHLSLEIEALLGGDKPHIPLPHPIVLDSGAVMEGMGNLGQSVCVLSKV